MGKSMIKSHNLQWVHNKGFKGRYTSTLFPILITEREWKYLIPVSKEQVDWLIEHGYLKSVQGHYPDVTVTSRDKNSKRKHRWINREIAKYLPKVDGV